MLEAAQRRLDRMPEAMKVRRRTVEHVFGTFKHWVGYTHFLTRRLSSVSKEMSLNVLACNLKRVMQILGYQQTLKAVKLYKKKTSAHFMRPMKGKTLLFRPIAAFVKLRPAPSKRNRLNKEPRLSNVQVKDSGKDVDHSLWVEH